MWHIGPIYKAKYNILLFATLIDSIHGTLLINYLYYIGLFTKFDEIFLMIGFAFRFYYKVGEKYIISS